MTLNGIEIPKHTRSKPYAKKKAKVNARLAFNLMLKELEKNIDRALEQDRLDGWPDDIRQRIQEGGP